MIVDVALPSIGRDLHASVSVQWVLDANTLVISSLLILAGSLADRSGRKRTFQTGLALFSLSPLLCGLEPTADRLIGFRGLQAISGSMLNPVAVSIIVAIRSSRSAGPPDWRSPWRVVQPSPVNRLPGLGATARPNRFEHPGIPRPQPPAGARLAALATRGDGRLAAPRPGRRRREASGGATRQRPRTRW